jgi:hypothetical protein
MPSGNPGIDHEDESREIEKTNSRPNLWLGRGSFARPTESQICMAKAFEASHWNIIHNWPLFAISNTPLNIHYLLLYNSSSTPCCKKITKPTAR